MIMITLIWNIIEYGIELMRIHAPFLRLQGFLRNCLVWRILSRCAGQNCFEFRFWFRLKLFSDFALRRCASSLSEVRCQGLKAHSFLFQFSIVFCSSSSFLRLLSEAAQNMVEVGWHHRIDLVCRVFETFWNFCTSFGHVTLDSIDVPRYLQMAWPNVSKWPCRFLLLSEMVLQRRRFRSSKHLRPMEGRAWNYNVTMCWVAVLQMKVRQYDIDDMIWYDIVYILYTISPFEHEYYDRFWQILGTQACRTRAAQLLSSFVHGGGRWLFSTPIFLAFVTL